MVRSGREPGPCSMERLRCGAVLKRCSPHPTPSLVTDLKPAILFCQIFLAVACKLHLSFYRWMQTQVSKLVTVLGKCLLRSSLWVSATLLAALVAQKVSCLQCRRPQFHLWVSRIPLEKGMSTHSSILPGEFHGQRSMVVCSPWDLEESDMPE